MFEMINIYRLNMFVLKIFLLYSFCLIKINSYTCKYSIDKSDPEFYLVSTCHRSKFVPLYSVDFDSMKECEKFALKNRAMAFNFSPLERNLNKSNGLKSCLIFSCPEIENSTTFIEDFHFDYYSMFTYPIPPPNTTCIDKIGIFVFHTIRLNYTKSRETCQDLGADLADVGTETRTLELSKIISLFRSKNKMFYVGMDDIDIEGEYIRANEESIRCSTYRAWAPGHPKNQKSNQNCGTLDSNNMWRIVSCDKKLPFICEIRPNGEFDYFQDYDIFECGNLM